MGNHEESSMRHERSQKALVVDDEEWMRDACVEIRQPGPSSAQACLVADLPQPAFPTALGIFRRVEQPTCDDLLMSQINTALARNGRGDLSKLLNAGTTWLVD